MFKDYIREGEPEACPLCHYSVPLQELLFATTGSGFEIVYNCPRDKCGRYFIGRYEKTRDRVSPGSPGVLQLVELTPQSPPHPQLPDEISSLAPLFEEIYAQAMAAEAHGLTQVVGVGYRKAIEYLIKDYAVSIHPDDAESIKATPLGTCISKYVTDANIKACAKRAVWLGNDETHYVRKWKTKDIKDLKILITLTINWIHNDLLTRKYSSDMTEA